VTALIHESRQLPGDVIGHATWSPDRRYRYSLRRSWAAPLKIPATMVMIMLNPSTAGADANDQTITRCMAYARREGCICLIVVNLFALVSTSPKLLLTDADPIGCYNDQAILDACTSRDVYEPGQVLTVVAWGHWGEHPKLRARADYITDLLNDHQIAYSALGLTSGGQPLHPSRLHRGAPLNPVRFGVPTRGSRTGIYIARKAEAI
jgi:hypothetical protein